jgi:XTP/dITP diphosphohydrolase
MTPHLTILLGTHNPDKAQELRTAIQHALGNSVVVVMPHDVPAFPRDVAETGSTLEENAYLKALAVYQATGLPSVSDDTGLEVDALGGEPGVYSARYAGEGSSYADNRRKLLEALAAVKAERAEGRTARFRTVVCYHDDMRVLFAEGECEGRITDTERGIHGFGYDAVFQPQGYTQTFAELSPEEKHRISHRTRALEALAERLRAVYE